MEGAVGESWFTAAPVSRECFEFFEDVVVGVDVAFAAFGVVGGSGAEDDAMDFEVGFVVSLPSSDLELVAEPSFSLDDDPPFVGVLRAAALVTALEGAGVFGETDVDLIIVEVGVVVAAIVEPDCSSKW